jgi:hypothetical protein
VAYRLLADSRTYGCRTWEELVDRLLWAREHGFETAKARYANGDVDRPLIPSEQAWLIEAATARFSAPTSPSAGSAAAPV